jgi:hypothetical protein
MITIIGKIFNNLRKEDGNGNNDYHKKQTPNEKRFNQQQY